mgnify:CR=1 FL=1
MTMKIAVLPGDGTGPEVVDEALKVLKAVAASESIEYTTTEFDFGGDRYLAEGRIIDDEEILLKKTRDERKRDLIKKLNGPADKGDPKPEKRPPTEKKP